VLFIGKVRQSKKTDVKQVGRKKEGYVPQGEIRSAKVGRGARRRWCLSPILFDWYSECLAEESLEGFGDTRIGQVIHTVKYADSLVLLAKEEVVLQDMINRLIEIGRC